MNIKVKGKQVLSGEIYPSGSKNSAVHIIPSTLLFHEKVTLNNVPNITDVARLVQILEKLGSNIDWNQNENKLTIDNASINYDRLTEEDLGNMKGTSLLWGGLLGRFKKVDFSELPGGCTLGIRPFEPFFKSFNDFGIKVSEYNGGIIMDAKNAKPAQIWMTEMAVSVTSTLIMIATSLPGKTKIIGCASEPEVQDLCSFLTKAGAKITGAGSSVVEIEGGSKLNSTEHTLLSDHYEIATFIAIGAVTGGEIKVHNAIPELFEQINYEFSKFNVEIKYDGSTALVPANQEIKFTGSFQKKTNVVRAQPWPGFPVDLLPIMIPLAMVAPGGYMMYHNWMYESGLHWTGELSKLGADVVMCDPHRVIVNGGNKLHGAILESPYIIRAVVAMVMAAMVSKGESTILNADALYRGHPHFSENLKKLGAKIEEIG
jgi:UDP-N-acetylglucosamine 1-carboxyvinyltransferase